MHYDIFRFITRLQTVLLHSIHCKHQFRILQYIIFVPFVVLGFSQPSHISASICLISDILADRIRSRREQRPSFRRTELHNYTFERPPGRWGLRENRQPISIYTRIACDCRPYCPPAVADNDRLAFFVRTVSFFGYRCCHLLSTSAMTCTLCVHITKENNLQTRHVSKLDVSSSVYVASRNESITCRIKVSVSFLLSC